MLLAAAAVFLSRAGCCTIGLDGERVPSHTRQPTACSAQGTLRFSCSLAGERPQGCSHAPHSNQHLQRGCSPHDGLPDRLTTRAIPKAASLIAAALISMSAISCLCSHKGLQVMSLCLHAAMLLGLLHIFMDIHSCCMLPCHNGFTWLTVLTVVSPRSEDCGLWCRA